MPLPNTWRHLESGQTSRLCTFDLAASKKRVIYETADSVIEAPNWTPDGASLIYNQDGLLYRIDAGDGGAPALIDAGDVRNANNDHVLAPGGGFVYISANDGHLYEVPVAGGTPRRVSNSHDRPFIYFLHGITPDGRTLAYIGAEEVDGNAFGSLNIFTVPVAGGPDVQITRSDKPHDGPEYSPDGTWIYFNSERASSTPGHAQLFRMRADGSDITQLTFDERVNWFPHISPTGDRVVYVSYEPGTVGHPPNRPVEIRSIGPAGGPVDTLLSVFGGQGTMNVNSWAPDGQRFAFVEFPRA
jgi:Tol biopolymer transport system component